MSSMDQAFVKAFSRRRLAATDRRAQHGEPQEVETNQSSDAPGSLRLDRSVEATAEVWEDRAELPFARADQASLDVPAHHIDGVRLRESPQTKPAETDPPKRHVAGPVVRTKSTQEIDDENANGQAAPATSGSDPLQHIHTAYAGAFADSSLIMATTSFDDAVESAFQIAEVETDDPAVELPLDPPASAASSIPGTDNVRAKSDQASTFVPFQAVWEVDVFDVPTPVADLFFEGALFQQIAERMSDAVGSGLRSVLVTSAKPGEGRSSVAIGMAMAAAAAGIRVALVDADTESPSLADELRLELQYGWVDVIRRGLPVKEVAVHAIEDGVTLIPLLPPGVRPAATAFEVAQLMDLLHSHFELIIMDGPTSLHPGLYQCASKFDSAVIVRDVMQTDERNVNELTRRLRESGVRGIGVVENFV